VSAPGLRPRALRRGDVIGICAPSGMVSRDALERGAAVLRALGFTTRLADAVFEQSAFSAGTPARRAADLQGLFADPEVAGILCARGGAGSAHILPLLDPAVLRANPKVFVGYSDVTFLHLLLHQQGLVTFHGPMAARELADGNYDQDSFLSAVTGSGSPYATGPADELVPLRAGEGQGILRGGCLSILSAAAGTAWAFRPDPEGTILFIEDIDERPYRIDRMLFQLRASGAFEGVRGLVFGDMKGCAPHRGDDFRLEDVILDALAGLEVPVALGLSSGHTSAPNITLPLGVPARLACSGTAQFEVLEAGVS
jgi:muramoyltetrapeptide carboxypeptidase